MTSPPNDTRAQPAAAAEPDFKALADHEWHPVGDGTPLFAWLDTKLEGENGTNRCFCRINAVGDVPEWVTQDGRTTITHHSFAAPSHWCWPLDEVTKSREEDQKVFTQDTSTIDQQSAQPPTVTMDAATKKYIDEHYPLPVEPPAVTDEALVEKVARAAFADDHLPDQDPWEIAERKEPDIIAGYKRSASIAVNIVLAALTSASSSIQKE